MSAKYHLKINPDVVVEAEKWWGGNYTDLCEFVGQPLERDGNTIILPTPKQDLVIEEGDWVIKNIIAEYTVVKAHRFIEAYEPET